MPLEIGLGGAHVTAVRTGMGDHVVYRVHVLPAVHCEAELVLILSLRIFVIFFLEYPPQTYSSGKKYQFQQRGNGKQLGLYACMNGNDRNAQYIPLNNQIRILDSNPLTKKQWINHGSKSGRLHSAGSATQVS